MTWEYLLTRIFEIWNQVNFLGFHVSMHISYFVGKMIMGINMDDSNQVSSHDYIISCMFVRSFI